jgi:predicted MFS family arabinose efflux permease
VVSPARPGTRWSEIAHERNFLLFWAGQQCSSVGDGAYKVALAWLVYRTTGSSAAMGLILALNSIPLILGTSVGGLVADRFPRKLVIVAADGIAGVTVLLLAAAQANGLAPLPVIAAVAFVLGLAQALRSPSSYAIVPDLVPAPRLPQANSLFTVGGSLAGMIGPALGGILVAGGGITAAFTADGASFAVAVVATLATGTPGAVRHDTAATGRITAGLRYVCHRRWLMAIMLVSALVNFAALSPYAVLIPRQVMLARQGAALLGLVYAVQGGAAVVSATVIGSLWRQRSSLWTMWLLAAGIGLGTAISGLATSPLLLLLGSSVIGIGIGFAVLENTALQQHVPPEVMGRVYAVNTAVSYGPTPIGYLLAGIGGSALGIGSLLVLGGVATMTTVMATGLWAGGVPSDEQPAKGQAATGLGEAAG